MTSMNEVHKMIDYDLFDDVALYNHLKRNGLVLEKNKKYESILCSRYNKISRIKRRLIYLLTNFDYIWFITFTFDDYYINKCDRTKRDLIKSSLFGYDFKYILNVDYGSKTEREHYHCILATNYNFNLDDHIKNVYPCFSSSILCNSSLNDYKRLSKYINKLTNHCIKDTTKNKRIYFNFKLPEFKNDSYTQWIIYKKRLALLDKANTIGKES